MAIPRFADIRFSRPYTIYIIQIFVSDLSRVGGKKKKEKQKPALNRGSDLSPCVRNPEIGYIWKLSKIKINSFLEIILFYFIFWGRSSSSSSKVDRQPFVCGNLLPPDCSDLFDLI